MAQWVLSVAGIAILSVLADIILPNGSCRKYIKTVIGVVVTLVVAQPIFSLFGGNGFIADYREKQSQLAPQESYLTFVENCKDVDTGQIHASLVSADFLSPSVTFSAKDCRYTVTFTEQYTAERETRAKAAVSAVAPKYTVVFCWNNTE